MKYTPHDYQQYATEFIVNNPISAILLECGLGKTIITLTAIKELLHDRFLVSRVLIIAPLRVAKNTWSAEIEKWDHLKDLSYSIVVGTEADRIAALRKPADLYIINRENVQWLVETGAAPAFDMVVVDELSSFKSHQSKRFKALMKIRPSISRIVGLTGTPSSNGLMDLWAEFKLLDMGQRLGHFVSNYRSAYFLPDKCNGPIVYSYKLRPFAEEQIYDRISDITISMKAKDYLKMPECVSTQYPVRMSEEEKEQYDTLKKEMVLSIGDDDIDAVNAATLTNKLLQMANGAIYNSANDPIEIHQRKLDALEDLIESANGKPVLVAYWFKHDLERIKQRFEVREIKEARDIRDWNEKKIPIAVIHPAAAGHGLNLQDGGSTLIWFGLTWSLELYQQTNARLWRQGQKHTVTIHHIVTKDTVDEDVLAALANKDVTQEKLIAAVKARL